MSDRIRRTAGTLLILGCMTLCAVPAVTAGQKRQDSYRSGGMPARIPGLSRTEQFGTIRVNDADAEELTEMPGVGETLASLIIAERDKNGPFYYPEDLEAVKGIGPRKLEQLRGMLDLSTKESEE